MIKKDRINYAIGKVKDVVKKVWTYILLGVGIGAAIHNFIPQSIIESKTKTTYYIYFNNNIWNNIYRIFI